MSLPAWAVVTPERERHIARVAALLDEWAEQAAIPAAERSRWQRAAWLHDALRDVPGADTLAHGPAAAERAAADGEQDGGVLDAVRYHSVGFAGWDRVGRMLYMADYLEPGRAFDVAARRALAARVPREADAVLRAVAERRLTRVLRSGWVLAPESVAFWNSLAAPRRPPRGGGS